MVLNACPEGVSFVSVFRKIPRSSISYSGSEGQNDVVGAPRKAQVQRGSGFSSFLRKRPWAWSLHIPGLRWSLWIFHSFHFEARRSKERAGSNLWHPHSTLLLGVLCVLVLGWGRHRGGLLEAALPLLYVLLWMEQDDVGFGHVEHAEGH